MPKLGAFEYPNHDIDTIVDLIDESTQRWKPQTGTISEETFQNDVIDRHGGTYTRYRHSFKIYGLIERERGSDEVTVTERFVEIADPVKPSYRNSAISDAVKEIELFVRMFENGFEANFNYQSFRVWLIENQGVPRTKADEKIIEEIRDMYDSSYPYLKSSELDSPDAEDQVEEDSENDIPNQSSDIDMFHLEFENKSVSLPKEDIEKEWEFLKAMVDTYVNKQAQIGGEDNNKE